MSPLNQQITTQLRQLIYYNLDCNLPQNALFMAGRLHAYEPRASEALYLLSLCHLRVGQIKAAYDYSKTHGSRGTHFGCTYVFAQACLGLEKFNDGILALERSRGLWAARNNWNKHTESRRQHLPDAAAVYCLLGKLHQAHNDPSKAIDCYAEALKSNPFMWDAFTGLCDLGVNVRTPNIFKMNPEMMRSVSNTGIEETPLGILEDSTPPKESLSQQTSFSQTLPGNDPFSISTTRANVDNRSYFQSKAGLSEKLNGSSFNLFTPPTAEDVEIEGLDFTPTVLSVPGLHPAVTTGNGTDAAESLFREPPHAPLRKPRTLAGIGYDVSGMDAPPRIKAPSLRSRAKTDSDQFDAPPTSQLSSMLSSRIADRKRTVSGQPPQTTADRQAAAAAAASNDPGAPQRRSVRLFNQIRPQTGKFAPSVAQSASLREARDIKRAKSIAAKTRMGQSNVGRVVSGNRKYGDAPDGERKEPRSAINNNSQTSLQQRPSVAERSTEIDGIQSLLDLFTKLASGYFALSHYRCQDALQIFSGIPSAQRETPWVLAQMGRALYEQASYAEAEKFFARIKTMAPSRLEDAEVYSTILWHLRNEIELAYLAHEILDVDRLSPQAWCAVGNSFSLQRDHDQAIKCFKRATQLDPKFAYAFTLQGHEHVANEEYDKAMAAYRHGIAAEQRHYNAWYGLGKVFEKQGKYEVAEQHYRTAVSINPTNAVLICCIGIVLEKMKKPQLALEQYSRSCEFAPRSTLSRFKKARVLMALQRPEQALAELMILKDLAPDEANVHFLLGRVYKTLNQKGNAIKHFTTALNLDPKVRSIDLI
jgi:anaphase-promoting complex subunit 3